MEISTLISGVLLRSLGLNAELLFSKAKEQDQLSVSSSQLSKLKYQHAQDSLQLATALEADGESFAKATMGAIQTHTCLPLGPKSKLAGPRPVTACSRRGRASITCHGSQPPSSDGHTLDTLQRRALLLAGLAATALSTQQQLPALADEASSTGRKVSPCCVGSTRQRGCEMQYVYLSKSS